MRRKTRERRTKESAGSSALKKPNLSRSDVDGFWAGIKAFFSCIVPVVLVLGFLAFLVIRSLFERMF